MQHQSCSQFHLRDSRHFLQILLLLIMWRSKEHTSSKSALPTAELDGWTTSVVLKLAPESFSTSHERIQVGVKVRAFLWVVRIFKTLSFFHHSCWVLSNRIVLGQVTREDSLWLIQCKILIICRLWWSTYTIFQCTKNVTWYNTTTFLRFFLYQISTFIIFLSTHILLLLCIQIQQLVWHHILWLNYLLVL